MNNANFEYHVPTHIFFGDNQIQKLGAELAKHGSRVLLIYGSERLKSTPLYASILEQVKSAGLTLFEMGGVEPNPRHTTVDRAAGFFHFQKEAAAPYVRSPRSLRSHGH